MKTQTKIIAIISLSFYISSCVSSNKIYDENDSEISNAVGSKNLQTIDIDILKPERTINLSNIFRGVKTVVLETNKDVLIGNINSMQIYNDSIFILDSRSARGLFLFNKNGKFLRRIGNIGQGPGEYIEPSDFTLDKKHKFIYILDSRYQKILKYDIKSGNYINSLTISNSKYSSFHIQFVNGKLYADSFKYPYTLQDCMLQEINLTTGEREKKWLSTSTYHKNFTEIQFLGRDVFYDKGLVTPKFIQTFMDTVMSINKQGDVIPYLTIKSKDLLTKSDLSQIDGNVLLKTRTLVKMNKIYHINNFVSNQNLLYFTYCQKLFIMNLFYNMKTQKTHLAY